MFVSLYRRRSRARASVIKEWSMQASPREVDMAARRCILDANYRLHMKRAVHRVLRPEGQTQCTIEVSADIRTAFETVDRQLLWHYAKVHQYPLDLLFSSLQAYAWDRMLVQRTQEVHYCRGHGSRLRIRPLPFGTVHRVRASELPIRISVTLTTWVLTPSPTMSRTRRTMRSKESDRSTKKRSRSGS